MDVCPRAVLEEDLDGRAVIEVGCVVQSRPSICALCVYVYTRRLLEKNVENIVLACE